MTAPETPAPAAVAKAAPVVEKPAETEKPAEKPKAVALPKGTDPKCTHCFGTGYITHGNVIPCPWCTDEGKAKHAAARG